MTCVEAAQLRDAAATRGFVQSCEDKVGELLAVLAASVRAGGRILELGTGVGVGTAWIVHGLGARLDVEVLSVELDGELAAIRSVIDWPNTVGFLTGDALELLPDLGTFDLVFADAVAGKWFGLDLTLAALAERGILIVDDMTPPFWADDEHEHKTAEVRERLLTHPELRSVELAAASGLILATRSTTGGADGN